MKPAMHLERFAELIDAYGAEPRRWPAAERSAALAFASADATAAVLLRDAAALDALLDADVAAAATAEAGRAVRLAVAATVDRPASRWHELLALLGGWRIALPTTAMALVAGINIGATAGTVVFSTDEMASAATDDMTGDDLRYRQGFAERLLLDLQQVPQ